MYPNSVPSEMKISVDYSMREGQAGINVHSLNPAHTVTLWFLFTTFFKIGCLAFGGFMALVSVVESIVVKKLNLLRHSDMLDGIALANLLPGPMAVNTVAFVGYRLRGSIGAAVAAFAVTLPAFLLMLVLSYLYFSYGRIEAVSNFFMGFIPAIAAVVISVVMRMAKKTLTNKNEFLLAAAAATLMIVTPQHYLVYLPILIILCCAFIGMRFFHTAKDPAAHPGFSGNDYKKPAITIALLSILVLAWFFPLPLEPNSPALLMLTFAGMSLMLFGGGYVFIPIIGGIVVTQYAWLDSQQFMDSIALGQLTPGPILISATFIGYKVAGVAGAVCATIAIFTPPAILMIAASQMLETIQNSTLTKAAMRAIHCGVIGMIFVAAAVILQAGFASSAVTLSGFFAPVLIFIAALIALMKYNADVIWVIPPAGLIGYLVY